MKKANYSYIGISFIVLVFGIIFIPRIIDRIKKGDITRNERVINSDRNDNKEEPTEKLSLLGL